MKKTKRCVFSLCEGGLEAAGWWYEVERQSHDWSMIVERMLTKRPVGVCGAFISFSDFTARVGIEYILFYPGTVEGLGRLSAPKDPRCDTVGGLASRESQNETAVYTFSLRYPHAQSEGCFTQRSCSPFLSSVCDTLCSGARRLLSNSLQMAVRVMGVVLLVSPRHLYLRASFVLSAGFGPCASLAKNASVPVNSVRLNA